MEQQTIKDLQNKILDIMIFIDRLCRDNNVIYYIMGGTALGAVRHGGFIPWDDDLDIFMTPDNYEKFKIIFNNLNNSIFVLQEWRTTEKYLEYAKVRMNGTTFIEKGLKERKDMHHGIYVDIMILHKIPLSNLEQKIVYYQSKYVTIYGLYQRNWIPKTNIHKIMLWLLRILPNKIIANMCYKHIYKHDKLKVNYKYYYFITKVSFKQGIYDADFFEQPIDILFEDVKLMASKKIKEYLSFRYGDYIKLPTESQQNTSIHAEIFDTICGYENYINKN